MLSYGLVYVNVLNGWRLHCFNQGLPVFGRAERVIIADSNKRCEDANFQHQQFIDQCQFS